MYIHISVIYVYVYVYVRIYMSKKTVTHNYIMLKY